MKNSVGGGQSNVGPEESRKGALQEANEATSIKKLKPRKRSAVEMRSKTLH